MKGPTYYNYLGKLPVTCMKQSAFFMVIEFAKVMGRGMINVKQCRNIWEVKSCSKMTILIGFQNVIKVLVISDLV